jgi:hypothetical protein
VLADNSPARASSPAPGSHVQASLAPGNRGEAPRPVAGNPAGLLQATPAPAGEPAGPRVQEPRDQAVPIGRVTKARLPARIATVAPTPHPAGTVTPGARVPDPHMSAASGLLEATQDAPGHVRHARPTATPAPTALIVTPARTVTPAAATPPAHPHAGTARQPGTNHDPRAANSRPSRRTSTTS